MKNNLQKISIERENTWKIILKMKEENYEEKKLPAKKHQRKIIENRNDGINIYVIDTSISISGNEMRRKKKKMKLPAGTRNRRNGIMFTDNRKMKENKWNCTA